MCNKKIFFIIILLLFLLIISNSLFALGVFEQYDNSGHPWAVHEFVFEIGKHIIDYCKSLDDNEIEYTINEDEGIIISNWDIYNSSFKKITIANSSGIIIESHFVIIPDDQLSSIYFLEILSYIESHFVIIPDNLLSSLYFLEILSYLDNRVIVSGTLRGPPWNVDIKDNNGRTCVRFITLNANEENNLVISCYLYKP